MKICKRCERTFRNVKVKKNNNTLLSNEIIKVLMDNIDVSFVIIELNRQIDYFIDRYKKPEHNSTYINNLRNRYQEKFTSNKKNTPTLINAYLKELTNVELERYYDRIMTYLVYKDWDAYREKDIYCYK